MSNTLATPANGRDHTPAPQIDAAAAAPEAVLSPTPAEIDEAILEFESGQLLLAAAKETQEAAKQRLVFLVESFGSPFAGAEQSLRLAGRHNTATITKANLTTIYEPAVIDLRDYLAPMGHVIFERLFVPVVKHKLVESGREVLKALNLPRRVEEKILALYGKCYDVKPANWSVKVAIITPEKPERKPRAGKAGA